MPFVVETPTLADKLRDRLAPWLTPEQDPTGDHANLLVAKAAMGETWWQIITDHGDDPDDPSWVPGFGTLFDVDLIPNAYLPYLAQLVGVPGSALIGADDATARQIIRAEQSQQRGTPGAILAAAKRNLSGSQSVFLVERTAADGSADPYHFQLIVRPEEIIDLAQLTNVVNGCKPGGIMWTLIQSDAPLVSQYTRLFSAITVPLGAATLADVT